MVKHKINTFKQINKSEDYITRVDEQTFYVKSSRLMPDGKTLEPYMVFNSLNEGWLCDCLSFVFNLKDNTHPHTPDCKHIKAIKTKYNIS